MMTQVNDLLVRDQRVQDKMYLFDRDRNHGVVSSGDGRGPGLIYGTGALSADGILGKGMISMVMAFRDYRGVLCITK